MLIKIFILIYIIEEDDKMEKLKERLENIKLEALFMIVLRA